MNLELQWQIEIEVKIKEQFRNVQRGNNYFSLEISYTSKSLFILDT